jgi:hypothetical protein
MLFAEVFAGIFIGAESRKAGRQKIKRRSV